jgi:G3E family GTPase
MTLLGEMIEMAVPCVVVLNKIDLLDKVQLEELMVTTKKLLTWAPWIPTTTISAREEIGIEKIMKWAKKISDGRDQRISTHKLNDTLKKAWLANPPRFPKNKVCKFYYATQVEVRPLTIVLFINDIGKANYAFTRWVQNVMRTAFGLDGVPINIKFKDKEEDGQKWESREAWDARLKARDEAETADDDRETEMQQTDKKKRAKPSDSIKAPRTVKGSVNTSKVKMTIIKDEDESLPKGE